MTTRGLRLHTTFSCRGSRRLQDGTGGGGVGAGGGKGRRAGRQRTVRTGPVAGLGWHPRGDVERIEWSTSTGDAGGAAGRLTLLVGILEGEGGGGAVLPRLGAEVVVEAGAGGHGLGVEVGGERAVLCTTSQPTHRRPVSASTVTAPAPQRTAHSTAPRAPPPARNRQPVPRAGAQVAPLRRALATGPRPAPAGARARPSRSSPIRPRARPRGWRRAHPAAATSGAGAPAQHTPARSRRGRALCARDGALLSGAPWRARARICSAAARPRAPRPRRAAHGRLTSCWNSIFCVDGSSISQVLYRTELRKFLRPHVHIDVCSVKFNIRSWFSLPTAKQNPSHQKKKTI